MIHFLEAGSQTSKTIEIIYDDGLVSTLVLGLETAYLVVGMKQTSSSIILHQVKMICQLRRYAKQ